MKTIKPTKTELAKAAKIVADYKASGIASNRFANDEANAYAFAIAYFTIHKADVLPTGSGDRKRAVGQATVIEGDWFGMMDRTTGRPDQFFEQRIKRAMAHAGYEGSWAWTHTDEAGWVLSQA
jgi:hypothetical protein